MNFLMKAVSASIITSVEPADTERAIAVLARAYSADPMARWMYPDTAQYRALFPTFVRAFGGCAFALGTARHIEDHAGVALWLPPGVEPDHDVIEASLPAGRETEIAAVFEEMACCHPGEAHWYLPLIGVDPAHQCEGRGAALLQDTLCQCDRDHVAAYLESTNAANITLYQRHGFELRATIQVGSAPPLFPMLRAAR
jgi:GNAT superfamily N-acetyltransferase